ncbi:MAG: hypothetical protein IJ800_07470 [Clostridia bacterium]|nr:hypothetical protein [Clostridia bacterium]
MNKPRVIFPFVEAGFGHIMTERSIADAFEKKYGDLCEVVRTDFYKENATESMRRFETFMADQVKLYNTHLFTGWGTSFLNVVFGSYVSTWFVVNGIDKQGYKDSLVAMKNLKPDVVVSTHWATNYVARHIKENRPLTVVYVPDAHVNGCFRYPSDLTMISAIEGYNTAKRRFWRFNKDNFKLVPFAIRKEAFEVEKDKAKLKEKLGLDERFTILVMDGAYGIGLMESLCKKVVEEDLPINVVAVCGKNDEVYKSLSSLKTKGQTNLIVFGFLENILEYIAAADLYFGKSGNGIAEPTFFGHPAIVTHCANYIEDRIAQHYINIGNTKKIFTAPACVDFIKKALNGGEEFLKMKEAAKNAPPFGAEKAADEIFELINKKYHLK